MHGECRVTSLTRPWLYTYIWDEAGRLKTVSKNGTLLATYAYDHHNRRSRKSTTAAAPQGAQTILYHYDQDDHLIAETRSDGTPLRTYVWLAERPLTVIEHAALANPPRSLHLQHDHLGTPRLARNDAGVIQWRWDSDGYGTTTPTHDPDGDGKATVINLRFPGQYYDQESGNYYNWNRYYSPRLGRYLSADPIGIEGGANGYGYVGGNPLSRTDPLALQAVVPTPWGPMPLPLPMSPVKPAASVWDDFGGQIPSSAADDKPRKDGVFCPAPSNDDDKCLKKYLSEIMLCVAIAGPRYGVAGVSICTTSATTRYSECLKSGVSGITTPLHGVQTPL